MRFHLFVIELENLRKNNLVIAIWDQIPHIGIDYLLIDSFDEKGIKSTVSEPKTKFFDEVSSEFKYLTPIELTRFWKHTLRVTYDYPSHIEYVHQLQNWHYHTRNQEISLDKLIFEEDGLNLKKDELQKRMKNYQALQEHPKLFTEAEMNQYE